jgi:hypothetical protein
MKFHHSNKKRKKDEACKQHGRRGNNCVQMRFKSIEVNGRKKKLKLLPFPYCMTCPDLDKGNLPQCQCHGYLSQIDMHSP